MRTVMSSRALLTTTWFALGANADVSEPSECLRGLLLRDICIPSTLCELPVFLHLGDRRLCVHVLSGM
jgi:hypothetical protein